jgi:hypothetical protein
MFGARDALTPLPALMVREQDTRVTFHLLHQVRIFAYARRPNDVRIDCKAAKHSDGDRGALFAPLREWPRRKRAAPERGLL